MLKAVSNVNDVLGPAVLGLDPTDQRGIDDIMIKIDGTANKSNLGANAILGKFTQLSGTFVTGLRHQLIMLVFRRKNLV